MVNKRQRKKNQKKQSNKSPIRGLKHSEQDEFNRLRKNVKSKLNRMHKVFGNEMVTAIYERDEQGNIKKNGKVYYDVVSPEYFIQTPKITEFKTKKEMKEWMEKAKKFTDRGYSRFQFTKNEEGLVISKQVEERANKNSDIAIESAKKVIESKKDLPIAGGRTTLGERLEMQKDDDVGGIRVPKAFEFDQIKTKRRLLEKLNNLEKRRKKDEYFNWRNQVYKEGFIETLRKAFNSDANDVVKMLETMDAGDLFNLSLQYDELSIDNYYAKHQIINSDDDDLNKVREYVLSYYEGNIDADFLLKNFPNG
jgi:hypothetical protein